MNTDEASTPPVAPNKETKTEASEPTLGSSGFVEDSLPEGPSADIPAPLVPEHGGLSDGAASSDHATVEAMDGSVEAVPTELPGQENIVEEGPSVHAVVAALDEKLEVFLKANAAFSREAFATIKSELADYKEDFVVERERGLLIDLIGLFDSMNTIRSFYEVPNAEATGEEGVMRQRFVENLDGLAAQVEEILRRKDVERYSTSEKLDINWQKAVEARESADPGDERKVLAVRKSGFSRQGKPFRKEEVIILRYKASKDAQQQPTPQTTTHT